MKFRTGPLWRSPVRNRAEPGFTTLGLRAGGFFPGTGGLGLRYASNWTNSDRFGGGDTFVRLRVSHDAYLVI
ncbi:hypothetical protein Hanom_Chr10g00906891 [Helianthus anomalus]